MTIAGRSGDANLTAYACPLTRCNADARVAAVTSGSDSFSERSRRPEVDS